MFRLRPSGLPEEPTYPADLDKLGYFISQKDEICSKQSEREHYRFYNNRNHRHNIVRREAFHTCLRKEILNRLSNLGVWPLYLPQKTTEKPTQEAHIPILTTPPAELRTKKHIVLINNASNEDLAIWSWRVVSQAGGINLGSAISLVDEIRDRCLKQNRSNDTVPGFIILNPGQQVYSYSKDTTLTYDSWSALPRDSAVHEMHRIHPKLNFVDGHRSHQEHVESVFKTVIDDENFVRKDATIMLIGLRDGGHELSSFLDQNWQRYSSRILALALSHPRSYMPINPSFASFLANRSRAWVLSHHPAGIPLANAEEEGYPQVSGGHDTWGEVVITTSFKMILDWFEEAYTAFVDGGDYKNPRMTIPEAVLKEIEEAKKSVGEPDWGQFGADDEDSDVTI